LERVGASADGSTRRLRRNDGHDEAFPSHAEHPGLLAPRVARVGETRIKGQGARRKVKNCPELLSCLRVVMFSAQRNRDLFPLLSFSCSSLERQQA
jgi:hypothetical protein